MSKKSRTFAEKFKIRMEEITFDKRNYRRHDEKNKRVIRKSLEELGAGRSVVIDKEGTLIAGNGVYEQAQKLKMPVRVVETDGSELVVVKRTDLATGDEKRKKLALADNVASDLSDFDNDLLQEDFTIEELGDWGLEFEIQTENKEAQEDDFDEEKDKVESVCQEGDLWQLGDHRLLCGDSTKTENVQLLMQGEQADLWLTDPPYNVGYSMQSSAQMSRQNHRTDGLVVKNDRQEDSAFHQFLIDAYAAAFANMKKGAAFYIWHSGLETYNFIDALKANNQQVRSILIWNKNRLVIGRQDYQWKHEPCIYGWKDGAAHRWYSDRSQTTVIDWNRPTKNEEHPTMKPVGLFGYQINNSSTSGDIVLDTFGGAGTTIVACEQLHRKARIMELDPHYCDVIIARWEKLTGQKANKIV